MVIIERLVRATLRGVKVRILARPPHSLKPDKLTEGVGGLRILQDVGVRVHTMKHLRLHVKMMLADGERAIVGSINLAPGSSTAAANWPSIPPTRPRSSGLSRSATRTGRLRARSISATTRCCAS